MINVLKYSLGQLQTNCYFVIEDKKCLVIDPADEADFILEQLQRNDYTLVALLATHGHFDHIMAAGEIQKSLKVPLYIFKEDFFLIERLNETARHFLGYSPYSLKPDKISKLNAGNLSISGFHLKVIKTPGHTPGSASFFLEQKNLVFSGDTLFKDAIGRYDFSYANKVDLESSLSKLMKLPAETIVYPGHGEETTIKAEKINLRV